MLYKRLSEEYNEIVRGIYGTSDIYGYSSFIESGKFFEESDYKNKTATAVIGSSMQDKVYTENGKQYFDFIVNELIVTIKGVGYRLQGLA